MKRTGDQNGRGEANQPEIEPEVDCPSLRGDEAPPEGDGANGGAAFSEEGDCGLNEASVMDENQTSFDFVSALNNDRL